MKKQFFSKNGVFSKFFSENLNGFENFPRNSQNQAIYRWNEFHWNLYVLSYACLTPFFWLLVDSSWLLLIQPDHYSIKLICDVTNDMGFLYSLFQYKSDCTNVAKVIAFDRFQIMARDLTSIAAMTLTLSPVEPDMGPQLIHIWSTIGP